MNNLLNYEQVKAIRDRGDDDKELANKKARNESVSVRVKRLVIRTIESRKKNQQGNVN